MVGAPLEVMEVQRREPAESQRAFDTRNSCPQDSSESPPTVFAKGEGASLKQLGGSDLIDTGRVSYANWV